MTSEQNRKNKTVLFGALLIVAAMIALTLASVPLYRLFCQVTGFGGTTQEGGVASGPVSDREITVYFNADTSPNLPWVFRPEEREISVHLGQQALTAYSAANRTAQRTGGTALYNVTPAKAGKYFHKIQCFCFDEQYLKPGERMDMPVLFYIDPSLEEDRSMDDVDAITLSYTFFPAETAELDNALEDFYTGGEPAAAPDASR